MEKVAILIETKNGEIKQSNFGVVTAARGNDHELYAFLIDGGGIDHKAALEAYGIHNVVEITSDEGPLPWNPVTWSKAVISAMQHFGINTLLGLTSAQGKELLPRIAARLDAPLIMDCIAVNLAGHTVEKSQYSGKTIATIITHGSLSIYGMRPNAIEPETYPETADLITFLTEVDSQALTIKEIKQGGAGGIDLTEADVIISGGRAMENTENFRILRQCAEPIGAAVGASRVAVDAGWVPHSMQVGQTGATVSPKVYIACGISGSVQHFAGMKTSGLIIAINTDPEAAIIKRCDYFVVADLFDIIPLITSKLKAQLG
ncbi:Electron transfer flavoprotein, alpha subunit [Olavius sp. associated proteobacterium Delta 1]|nr:Electron transfer flavoprotein, alpha subunit [Olavius sp. associated proteobacterium Delta 1]